MNINAATLVPPEVPAVLAPFLDPLALAIVGGGTVTAVILRTPWRDLRRAIAALRTLPRRPFDGDPLLAQIAGLTRIARKHGMARLDQVHVDDPDVAAAVAAAIDGASPQAVGALVRHHHLARIERHRAAGDVWAGAAEIAPAMGMVGTLVGLVKMFLSMSDPATIGGAMAIALLTTLYGAVLANLVAMPVAVRLRRRARVEALERARIEAPLVALAALEPSYYWGNNGEIAA
jgi:chemotaxis protein MotA